MAGGKLPPRQKMIGMMYLVLLAMLAMNMSKDILNAFVLIGDSLIITNKTFANKNESVYSAFDKALAEDKEKVKPFHEKAMKVKAKSKEIVDYIDKLKIHLLREVDKIPESIPDDSVTIHKAQSKDNYDVPTHILIGAAEAPIDGEWTARDLKKRVESFRDEILGFLPEKTRKGMDIGLKLEGQMDNGVEEEWGVFNFDHLPIAPVITILTKVQTDVMNAEADVIKALYNEVSAEDFKFDVIEAKMIPSSNYVLVGDSFKADIFVAAYSKTATPAILVGDFDTASKTFKGPVDSIGVKDGVGKYGLRTSAEGSKTWGGLIKLKTPSGAIKEYPFSGEYMVAKPALVVSPTAMNVLYIGVDNPIDISVPGVAAENLVPTLSGGSLTGGKGKYVARVTGGSEAIISASAKMGAKSTPMGTFKFRVKRVPDPVAKFGSAKGSANVPKVNLVNTAGVIAEMENFDFDLKFNIIGFDITAVVGGFEKKETSTDNKVTASQKTLMTSMKAGGKIIIENIKAKGPDGTVRNLSPISIKVM